MDVLKELNDWSRDLDRFFVETWPNLSDCARALVDADFKDICSIAEWEAKGTNHARNASLRAAIDTARAAWAKHLAGTLPEPSDKE